MDKKRLVISYKNLSGEAKKALVETYPEGYEGHVFKVELGPKSFYAIRLETEQASYLVKVDVGPINDASFDEDEDDRENDISFEEKISQTAEHFMDGDEDDEGDEV